MNAFVPITSTFVDPTGALIALGAAPIGDTGGSAAALEPLFQMSNRFHGSLSPPGGRLAGVVPFRRVSRISSKIAAAA